LPTCFARTTERLLITHTGTLLYSFGLRTRPEGITHVFRPHDGRAEYVGGLTPFDWLELAGIVPAAAD